MCTVSKIFLLEVIWTSKLRERGHLIAREIEGKEERKRKECFRKKANYY